MGMNPVMVAVVVYLVLGIMLLAIFDLVTRRIRSKLTQATGETQSRLAASGNYVGGKLAFALFLGTMWLFWPMVFVGALTDKNDKEEDSHGA